MWCVSRSTTGSHIQCMAKSMLLKLFVKTWQHWGQFRGGYRPCKGPAPRSVLATVPQHSVVRRSDRFFCLQREWETPTRSAKVYTQHLPRRKMMMMMMMKILLMTARWRSCFSIRTLQESERVTTGCSSSTLMSNGEEGSSTWPQVRGGVTPGLCRRSNMAV